MPSSPRGTSSSRGAPSTIARAAPSVSAARATAAWPGSTGSPSQRTCQVPCRPGLAVETQNGLPGTDYDLLGAIDAVYARGLDHHHLMTWSMVANRAAVAVSRLLAGAGKLPDSAPPPLPAPVEEGVEALVVGAGPAGLAAAAALAARGRRVLTVDTDTRVGGRLRAALPARDGVASGWVEESVRAIVAAGGELALGWTTLGLWRDGGSAVAVLRSGAADAPLRLVRPTAIALYVREHRAAPGVPPQRPAGDLRRASAGPRALRARRAAGRRCVVAGGGPRRRRWWSACDRAGWSCSRWTRRSPPRAAGAGSPPSSSIVASAWPATSSPGAAREPPPPSWRGRSAPPSLPRRPEAGRAGWTGRARRTLPGLWAAGDVVRGISVAEAVEAGRRAGEAAAAHR